MCDNGRRMIPDLERRRFVTSDGTSLAYQVRGPASAPAVVLSNGLGGTCEAYRHIYKALGTGYRILSWDYRGLYDSARPRDLASLEIAQQARDLDALLEHEKIDRALFVGWSMGVQVNFEYYGLRPQRFVGLAAINGTYGSPFNSALASRLTRYIIPAVLRLMQRQHKLIARVTTRSVAWSGLLPTLQRLGMVSPTVDTEVFLELSQGFSGMDFDVYARTMQALGRHDARQVLPHIRIPTAIITGDKDLLTPVFTAEKMVRQIAGATLTVIPGGTHYTPVEYPAVVNAALEALLARIPSHARTAAPRAAIAP